MENLFYISFTVGIIYTVVSFILGNVISFGDFDADIGIDWTDVGFLDIPISPFRPIVIASFVTVFGGIGLLVYKYNDMPAVLSLIIAFTSALVVSFVIYRLIVVPIYRAQNGLVHDINELEDIKAKVVTSIYGDRFGRIQYVVNDEVFSAPAVSIDNKDIKQGEQALIVKVENRLFYVKAISEDNIPE